MLISRTAQPTHRALVPFDEGMGFVVQPGESVAYYGGLDWRFEPLNPKEAQTWSRISDDVRVAATLSSGEVTTPTGNQ